MADGSKFDGIWLKNKRNGKGSLHMADGSKYEGNWLKNQKHGQGVLIMADGSKYVGKFSNNCKHNFGTEYYPNGQIKYKGKWKFDHFIEKDENNNNIK